MSIDKAQVREWLKDSDGYSIMDPQFFINMGIPEKRVMARSRFHSDDPELGKHAAHRADGKLGGVQGIAEFSAIHLVARELGVNLSDCREYFGRGSQYREYKSAVWQALKE